MVQRMKIIVLSLALLLGVGSVALPAVAFASASQADACAGLSQVDATNDCDSKGSGLNSVVAAVVNILGWIVGIAAIVMVIYSGMKYITSGGDSNKVSSAKNALIYALIGLAIASLSQVLVHYVLTKTHDTTADICSTNRSIKASSKDCKQ